MKTGFILCLTSFLLGLVAHAKTNNIFIGKEKKFSLASTLREFSAFDDSPPLISKVIDQDSSAAEEIQILQDKTTSKIKKDVRQKTEEIVEIDEGQYFEDYSLEGPEFSFEGLSNADNAGLSGVLFTNPDVTGAVGDEYYLQATNRAFSFYNKTSGEQVFGPFGTSTVFEGFSNSACSNKNFLFNPIVLWERNSGNFIFTVSSLTCASGITDFCSLCIAVIKNPFSDYFRYSIDGEVPFLQLQFAKVGVFRNNIAITANEFLSNPNTGLSEFRGTAVHALRRNELMSSNNLNFQYFFIPPSFLNVGALFPADTDTQINAPSSRPHPLMAIAYEEYDPENFQPGIFAFDLITDWSTGTGSIIVRKFIDTNPYNFVSCEPDATNCISQPGVPKEQFLFAGGDSFHNRICYSNFESYESIVAVHTIQVAKDQFGFEVVGQRWYELRRSSEESDFSLYQEGTFAPPIDNYINRWMGSIAQDKAGNIALGYSVSNAVDIKPGIRFTGRRELDPLGFMTLLEASVVEGTGVSTGTTKWGGYSAMTIDPNGCRFYYTQQYMTAKGQDLFGLGWQTKIAYFQLPGCDP